MRYLKYFALLAICMFAAAAPSHAQRVVVGVGVGPAYVGPAPVCAYGYYDYYPYIYRRGPLVPWLLWAEIL